MKDHDPRAFRHEGLAPVVGRPGGYAVVFEARAPGGRPVGQLALPMDIVGQIGLLVTKLPAQGNLVCNEMIENVCVCAEREAVHRGVTGHTPGPTVVLDDQELARHGEEFVETVDHDNVEIEEQRLPVQTINVGQIPAQRGQLAPRHVTHTGRLRPEVQWGNRETFDFGADAIVVVGQAHEAELSAQMASRHGVKLVDIA